MSGNQEMGAAGGGNFRGTTVNAHGGIVLGTTEANRKKAAANKAQANMNANMAAGKAQRNKVKNMLTTTRNQVLAAPNVGHTHGSGEMQQIIEEAGRHNLLPPKVTTKTVPPINRGRLLNNLGLKAVNGSGSMNTTRKNRKSKNFKNSKKSKKSRR